MARDRRRIAVKGLGSLEIRMIEPTAAESFLDVGYLQATTVEDATSEMVLVTDEAGDIVNAVPKDRIVKVTTSLLQTSKEEIDVLRDAANAIHAARYSGLATSGMFQYFAFEQVRVVPKFALTYQSGLRTLPLEMFSVLQDTLGFNVPLYYLSETKRQLLIKDLHLYCDPRARHNFRTRRLLDMSGFARHGQISSDVSTIWQEGTLPSTFLQFDGVNDDVDFGDIFNDDGQSDFMLECWFRIRGSDGTFQRVLSKKETSDDSSRGYAIYRKTNNRVAFRIADGSVSVEAEHSTTVQKDVWYHYAVAVDRNGDATPYLNAVAGSPVSVLNVTLAENNFSFYLARDSGGYGNLDIGSLRVYRFGAGKLPGNIATIISDHYYAERTYYLG